MKIGIIGGTGVYDTGLLEEPKEVKVHTPYGSPSGLVTTGIFKEHELVVIPRHGNKHVFNPTNVNYRANIWAMKELGVKSILAPSAVGSLKEEIKPGDLVFTDQFIDRTTKRKSTFYEGQQVCHISVAEPCCNYLRTLLINEARNLGLIFHEKGTCVVIEGPRFSTKAESGLFRSWNADIIGMTMCPEAVLAREAEICYATIAMVTDYDCWKDEHCDISSIMDVIKKNVENVKKLISAVIPRIEDSDCSCRHALKNSLI